LDGPPNNAFLSTLLLIAVSKVLVRSRFDVLFSWEQSAECCPDLPIVCAENNWLFSKFGPNTSVQLIEGSDAWEYQQAREFAKHIFHTNSVGASFITNTEAEDVLLVRPQFPGNTILLLKHFLAIHSGEKPIV
jgi:hypothetical protein